MSVHIISKGTKERTKYRVECPECGCVYEYNKEDVVEEEFGSVSTYHTNCPQCHNRVKHGEVPDFSKLKSMNAVRI